MIRLETFRGLLVRADTLDSYVVKEIVSYRAFLDHVPGLHCWDVGGNIGAMSRAMGDAGAASVTSFEPEQENFDLLTRNAPNAHAVRAALTGSHDGTIDFHINSGSNKGSHSAVISRGRRTVTVPAQSVATAAASRKPEAVKIDIEGGEYDTLPAILELGTVRLLALELHLNRKAWRNERAPNLLEQITKAGFEPIKAPAITASNWHTLGVWHRR